VIILFWEAWIRLTIHIFKYEVWLIWRPKEKKADKHYYSPYLQYKPTTQRMTKLQSSDSENLVIFSKYLFPRSKRVDIDWLFTILCPLKDFSLHTWRRQIESKIHVHWCPVRPMLYPLPGFSFRYPNLFCAIYSAVSQDTTRFTVYVHRYWNSKRYELLKLRVC
jgi:hypothetical protein